MVRSFGLAVVALAAFALTFGSADSAQARLFGGSHGSTGGYGSNGGGGSHGWRGLEGTFLLSSIITARRAAEAIA